MHPLQEIFQDADIRVRSYSGRGMYGAACLGVVGPLGQVLQLIFDAAFELALEDDGKQDKKIHALRAALRGVRTDSLGQDTIVYFPGVPFDGANCDESYSDDGEEDPES